MLFMLFPSLPRFEGDLKEKGLKPSYNAASSADSRFEGDLKEKGLKPFHGP